MVFNAILRVLLNPLTEMPITLFKRHVLVGLFLLAVAAAVVREEVHIAPEVAIGGGKSSAAVKCPEVPKINTVSLIGKTFLEDAFGWSRDFALESSFARGLRKNMLRDMERIFNFTPARCSKLRGCLELLLQATLEHLSCKSFKCLILQAASEQM